MQKSSETFMVFNILTCKCASRHSGVPVFDIPTSRSGPSMVRRSRQCSVPFFDLGGSGPRPRPAVLKPFDLELYFAPQGRAVFYFSSGQMAPFAALSSLLFGPPDPQIIEKTQRFVTVQHFAHLFSFSLWLFPVLSSNLLFSAFYLSILSEKFDF